MEREKKLKEIEQEIENLDRKAKEILDKEEMKRFSVGIFLSEDEHKIHDELQKELLEIMKRKRELIENKKLLQK